MTIRIEITLSKHELEDGLNGCRVELHWHQDGQYEQSEHCTWQRMAMAIDEHMHSIGATDFNCMRRLN